MNDIAIRVENMSKQYRIGQREPYKALREVLTDALAAPFRRLRSTFQRSNVERSNACNDDYIWALNDVSFEVKQGEVVGIIGRNGAGKTTLLKILSRITESTVGRAEIHGRVGCLLEVGTGFHPELTGRENIYLNGAILGMNRVEIDRKFDEIVDFSGVEKFIDTPVKRFSSGMHVRLAFSVAAHLESEILLVDEVLAVGDVEFQKKCLGKMGAVAKGGRTILLVSHNMAAIRNLCQRTLLLDSGRILVDGETNVALSEYLGRNLQEGPVVTAGNLEKMMEGYIRWNDPSVRFDEIALVDASGQPRNRFRSDEEIRVSITYKCLTAVSDLRVVVHIVDEMSTRILTSQDVDGVGFSDLYRREAGVYRSVCLLPANTFGEDRFYVSAGLIHRKVESISVEKVLRFEVDFRGYNNFHAGNFKDTWIRPRLHWQTERLTLENTVF